VRALRQLRRAHRLIGILELRLRSVPDEIVPQPETKAPGVSPASREGAFSLTGSLQGVVLVLGTPAPEHILVRREFLRPDQIIV
jgi:hypothetical protein